MVLEQVMREDLHIPGDFWHWASFHKHGGHLCVSFEKCLFRSLPIFSCIIYFSAIELWEFFISFNMTLLSDTELAYLFWWLSGSCLYILLTVLQFHVPLAFCLFSFFFLLLKSELLVWCPKNYCRDQRNWPSRIFLLEFSVSSLTVKSLLTLCFKIDEELTVK